MIIKRITDPKWLAKARWTKSNLRSVLAALLMQGDSSRRTHLGSPIPVPTGWRSRSKVKRAERQKLFATGIGDDVTERIQLQC